MRTAVIIPARYASTRLPGKPLLAESGKPLIQHTYEQAKKSAKATSVIVASDDDRIIAAVEGFGGRAVMTAASHTTGSARIAEAAKEIDADIIVNLQGDEPEIEPGHIDRVIELAEGNDCFAATLACPFPKSAKEGQGSPGDPSAVKAILGETIGKNAFWARYFTRHISPFPRDKEGRAQHPEQYFLHLGIYAFAKARLEEFSSASEAPLERAEKLEQLRILEMGGKIAVGIVNNSAPGIDTREDYNAFLGRQTGKA